MEKRVELVVISYSEGTLDGVRREAAAICSYADSLSQDIILSLSLVPRDSVAPALPGNTSSSYDALYGLVSAYSG